MLDLKKPSKWWIMTAPVSQRSWAQIPYGPKFSSGPFNHQFSSVHNCEDRFYIRFFNGSANLRFPFIYSQYLISISPYCQLHNFLDISLENLVLDQLIIPLTDIFLILVTCLFDILLVLKIPSWSLI